MADGAPDVERVSLDRATLALVRARAAEQDLSVPRYLSWFIRQHHNAEEVDLDENGRLDTVAPRVRALVRDRYADADIAVILNVSPSIVKAKREKAMLSPNARSNPLTKTLTHYLHEEGHLQ